MAKELLELTLTWRATTDDEPDGAEWTDDDPTPVAGSLGGREWDLGDAQTQQAVKLALDNAEREHRDWDPEINEIELVSAVDQHGRDWKEWLG